MYSLPYFKEKDPAVVRDFARKNPFAMVCGVDKDNRPVATQVPLFIDERDGKFFLSGHIMRNTDHHKAFEANPNVLAIFTGPHTYVSASWYENKQQASTWNYISVHAKGVLSLLDEQALRDILRRTTNHFENNPHSGANFEDIPADYIDKLINAIVAFEIEVVEMENVFKLSQNHEEKNFHSIRDHLHGQDEDGRKIAGEMDKRHSQVFGKKE